MALQGTLDTFELPDVLRLLSSTRKTGRLCLHSDRGTGDVWIADGAVVGVEAAGADAGDLQAGLFELLRAHEGSFAFEPGESPSAAVDAMDVEPLLAAAEAQLVDWRAIEAVVPSLESWLCLATELPGPTVTVDADTWRLVATIGSGLTVGDLGRVLGLGEVAVSRLVRDLVELGLGAVGPAPAPAAASPVHARREEPLTAVRYEPEPDPEPVVAATYEPAPAYEPEPEHTSSPLFGVEEPAGYAEPFQPYEPAPVYAPEPAPPVAADDDDEVARQLAMLSPRAAQAVAAAAQADTDADRQAAFDAYDAEALDDGDEPVNRGLLLKFLGSVKS